MGIYTSYSEEWIDAKVVSKLDLISNIILKNLQGIHSIILTGGFGRGEGSVRLIGNNEINLLKDFDIVVIVDPIPSEDKKNKILEQIYNELGLRNAELERFRFSKFVVDIRYLKKRDLAYSDIWFYDFKSASKVLYGQSVANLTPYNADDIPFSSGFRILFEKVTGLLGHFSYEYVRGTKIETSKNDSLVYECLKAYIEMGTVLCILAKRYKPSYLDRTKIIKTIYKSDFNDLAQEIPNLPELIERATIFKLKPDAFIVEKDPVDLWFSTRNDLGIIIRYYLSKYSGLPISNWTDLQQLKKYLIKTYYIPLLESWLRQRSGIFNSRLVIPVNYLYHILTNIEYIYQLKNNENRLYFKPLARLISPSLKFYLAAPLVLFALDRTGKVRNDYINLFFNELKFCIPIEINEDENIWENARNLYLKAYRLYNGFHLIK